MKKSIAIVLILLLFFGCASRKHSISNFSGKTSLESEIGEAIHRQVLQSLAVSDDALLNEYVRSVGVSIASVAKRQDLIYRFIILEDERIHATHAPGGYVYVTTGFLKFLHSEIELAGILAMEVALLQYKDPRLSKIKKTLDLLIRTGTYVGPAFGTIGGLSVLGLALVGNMVQAEKSMAVRLRDGDKTALKYLLESGFDPQGFIDPLIRMADPKSSYRPYLFDYLESHSVTSERLGRLENMFHDLPLDGINFDARRSEFLAATENLRKTNQSHVTPAKAGV